MKNCITLTCSIVQEERYHEGKESEESVELFLLTYSTL